MFQEDEEDDEDEEAAEDIDEIEAMLKEEFPLEEDNEDSENVENEETATKRLELEIEQRFVTDERDLATGTVQRQTHKPMSLLFHVQDKLFTVNVFQLLSYILLFAFLSSGATEWAKHSQYLY